MLSMTEGLKHSLTRTFDWVDSIWIPSTTQTSLTDKLPFEILSYIFSFLVGGTPCNDVFTVTLVCRHWREVAINAGELWTNVDLRWGTRILALCTSRAGRRPMTARLVLDLSEMGVLGLNHLRKLDYYQHCVDNCLFKIKSFHISINAFPRESRRHARFAKYLVESLLASEGLNNSALQTLHLGYCEHEDRHSAVVDFDDLRDSCTLVSLRSLVLDHTWAPPFMLTSLVNLSVRDVTLPFEDWHNAAQHFNSLETLELFRVGVDESEEMAITLARRTQKLVLRSLRRFESDQVDLAILYFFRAWCEMPSLEIRFSWRLSGDENNLWPGLKFIP